MTKKKYKETDLYLPVAQYFSAQGFDVYGEVNDCDLVAVKGEEIIIVELKLQLTIDLFIQASNRQKLSDNVYIAVPKIKYKKYSRKWHDLCSLLKKLGFGLITVQLLSSGAYPEIILTPSKIGVRKSPKKIKKLLKELEGRHQNFNVGGSHHEKIMTAYKENCLQIAYLLKIFGPMSPKSLRTLGTGEKTQSILFHNYYGWFEKVKRGIYQISVKGEREIENFPEILAFLEEKYSSALKDK